jgi:PAS domain S-box-containing protein
MEEKIESLARFPAENPNPVLRLNREGIILYANNAGKTLLQDWGREVVDHTPKFLRDVVVETLINQSDKTFEIKLGKQVYSIIVTPVMGADYANIYGIDITERKRDEENLRQSEENYRGLFESTLDGIVVSDAEGVVVSANQAAAIMLGYKNAEELVNVPAETLYGDPQDRRVLFELLAKKGTVKDYEVKLKRKDGKTFDVRVTVVLQRDLQGNVLRSESIFRDITERKKVEMKLRESEEKYRNLAENSKDVIAVVDFKGNVLFANKAAERLTGYTLQEGKGMNIRVVTPKRLWLKSIAMLLKARVGQAIPYFEYELKKKDGTLIPVETGGQAIFKDGKPVAVQIITRDITERKKAEEALRDSEEKHRVISGITADVVFSCVKVDEEGFAIDWMAGATEKIFGYSAKEIKDKGCWKFTVQPQDLPTFEEKVTGLKPGQSSVCELRITHKHGSTRWIKVSSQVKKDSSNPTNHRLFGACRDITERKKAEEELRETKNYLDNLLNYANAPIIVWDNENKISLFNNAFEALTGYKKESVLGRNIDVLFPPLQKEEILQTIEKATKGEKWQSVEVPILCKGKETRIALWNSANITDKDGNIVTTIAQGQDITERKKMEDELKQERDKLEAVTENIGAGLIIISKDYHTLWANEFIRRYKGDAEGKLCYATLNTLDNVCPDCGVKKVFENGATIDAHEYSSTDINGKPYWVELIATPIKDKDGNVIAALELAVDITEKKRMQSELAEYSQNLEKLVAKRTEELEQTQAKLVKSERLAAIGELAAMVGHDLRNPLQAIDNATYYLKNECARMSSSAIPPKAKEMLHVIGDSVNYADKIVRDLSDFSATKKPSLKRIDINMLVKETLSQAEAPRNVEINTELSQLPEIEVDEDQMKRVFLNLIANGIQAMENGGTLTVSTRKAEGFVEISFKDTGVGIPQDNMDKMFSPFFTTKATGMGVGLAICKKIVESHDGTIHVESEVGKRTTFTIKLPIRHETEVENVAKE